MESKVNFAAAAPSSIVLTLAMIGGKALAVQR